MKPSVTHYNFHGVSMCLTAPAAVTAILLPRLSLFQAAPDHHADPDFSMTMAVGMANSTAPPQGNIGTSRNIYELEGGEVLYHPMADTITASHTDLIRMTCHASAGKTEYIMTNTDDSINLATRILFTLPFIEMLRRHGLYNMHAAGLCRGTDAILLAGASGAGKSTLTLAMTRAGWAYMGDDMLFLKKDCVEIFGFPEGIDCLSENGTRSTKLHLAPELAFGTAALLNATPRVLLFPQIAHVPRTVTEPLSPDEAFLQLAPNVLMTDQAACEAHFDVIAGLTARTPAFRLHTGTDLAEATRVIGDLFRQIAPESSAAVA